MLQDGRRGLGFGVGQEPLASLFASRGCTIVATDLDMTRAEKAGWTASQEHAANLEALNTRGLCDPDLFRRRTTFGVVDMNHIPDDLREFDFTWSSCSLEHLGSIELGTRFLESQMDCLKPGGVAVHTTEFNLTSDIETLDHQPTVLFRQRDILEIERRLQDRGYQIELDLKPGDGLADQFIDVPPYTFNPQLKLQLEQFVTTSVGLIIEKPKTGKRVLRRLRGLLPFSDGKRRKVG